MMLLPGGQLGGSQEKWQSDPCQAACYQGMGWPLSEGCHPQTQVYSQAWSSGQPLVLEEPTFTKAVSHCLLF